jgi:alginate O-acetyltransferase complex protein AlgI
MNFTDGAFAVFFVATFALYYLASGARIQVAILAAASLFFYAWESPALLAVFLGSWLITGLSSYGVATALDSGRARALAGLGIAGNLGMLAFFKYRFLLFPELATPALGPQSVGEWLLLAPLPIGISFYTFHGISLLVDTLRGDAGVALVRREGRAKHLRDTLLYLAFFPQLIAGPIIKAKDFFPQVRAKRFAEVDFAGSTRLLILGYFLKRVVADNLAGQTFWIAYPYFQWKPSIDLWLLLYGYSAQIFADFAGYSLIALGLARLLGYRLPQNFDFPYAAASIAEFWRRWHMSLSGWLRDYLYVPLGGSRQGNPRTYANLLIVMLLGGLWHGAAWSFAIWGLWHGVGLVLERPWLASPLLRSERLPVRAMRVFLVFNFVSIGWLFFKLQDFSQALQFLGALVQSSVPGFSWEPAFLLSVYGAAVPLYHVAHACRDRIPPPARDFAYGAMLFLTLTNSGPATRFIYFQF